MRRKSELQIQGSVDNQPVISSQPTEKKTTVPEEPLARIVHKFTSNAIRFLGDKRQEVKKRWTQKKGKEEGLDKIKGRLEEKNDIPALLAIFSDAQNEEMKLGRETRVFFQENQKKLVSALCNLELKLDPMILFTREKYLFEVTLREQLQKINKSQRFTSLFYRDPDKDLKIKLIGKAIHDLQSATTVKGMMQIYDKLIDDKLTRKYSEIILDNEASTHIQVTTLSTETKKAISQIKGRLKECFSEEMKQIESDKSQKMKRRTK